VKLTPSSGCVCPPRRSRCRRANWQRSCAPACRSTRRWRQWPSRPTMRVRRRFSSRPANGSQGASRSRERCPAGRERFPISIGPRRRRGGDGKPAGRAHAARRLLEARQAQKQQFMLALIYPALVTIIASGSSSSCSSTSCRKSSPSTRRAGRRCPASRAR
jgi:hypothetical protein